ncbi:hypothetical protein R1flu_023095 [Riccia fluitans]|uniref:Uncharacterized protein n=1 Tax=Riccia fluitans TaxID=41844 RepID=A0ABD1XRS1_9MARC
MEKIIFSFVLLMLLLYLQAFMICSTAQLRDFLSIACGARKSYVDVQLGLKWDTDDNYVETGLIQQMDPE